MIVDDYVGGWRRMYLYWEDNTVNDLDMGHWNQFVENWKRLLSFTFGSLLHTRMNESNKVPEPLALLCD